MNLFSDTERLHGLIVGIVFMLMAGGVIVGSMVTAEARASEGISCLRYIIGAATGFLLVWMILDYHWYSAEYAELPLQAYVKTWLTAKFGVSLG